MTVLTVVRGEPSDDELAAVIAVIAARAQARPAQPEQGRVQVSRSRSAWADRSRSLRRPFDAGHGTWRLAVR